MKCRARSAGVGVAIHRVRLPPSSKSRYAAAAAAATVDAVQPNKEKKNGNDMMICLVISELGCLWRVETECYMERRLEMVFICGACSHVPP